MAVKSNTHGTWHDPLYKEMFMNWVDFILTREERDAYRTAENAHKARCAAAVAAGKLITYQDGWVWDNLETATSLTYDATLKQYVDRWCSENNITLQEVTYQEVNEQI